MKNPFPVGHALHQKFQTAAPDMQQKIVAFIAAQQPKAPGLSDIAVNVGKDVAQGKAEDVVTEKVAAEFFPGVSEMGPVPGYVPAAVAASTALAGKAGLDMLKGKTPEGASGKFGRAQLGAATGGLSEIANLMGFGGILGHKSTRDVARGHTEDLKSQGVDNKAWQDYVAGMRGQHDSAPPDPSKPFAGKYKSWDEYKAAGLEASDLTGVHGNLSTFGPDWAGYSQDQRQAITQSLIDNNLYESKKGEVEVTDKERAKQLGLAAIAPQQVLRVN